MNTLPSFAKSTPDEQRLGARYPMVGLNADWCCAAWQITDDTVIFDNEDDVDSTYSVLLYDTDEDGTRDIKEEFTGTIEECLNYLELGQ